jgi:L-seryl-tRNA(Ser) seleniumtransferase
VPDDLAHRLRALPSVDRLLAHPEIASAAARLGRAALRDAVRATLDDARAALRRGDAGTQSPTDAKARELRPVMESGDHRTTFPLTTPSPDDPATRRPDDPTTLAHAAIARAEASTRPSLRPAINATGIILNTGLGRAVLAEAAVQNLLAVARGHATLEVDLATGRRGDRLAHVEEHLCRLTGAEAAVVVNNNAAAVLLAIATLAAGREVVIARGQLVEIGGSFRMPDVIVQSGARLVEVGATNKVRREDYERAITPETALLLRCHPSNFRIIGFTSDVPLAEIVQLAHSRGLAAMDDLGSGALLDLRRFNLPVEPPVTESVATGADIVCFSGDKMLGGPQCGILVGKREALARARKHPLMRALRLDKLILAALEATLRLYDDPDGVLHAVPTLRALAEPAERVRDRARRLARRLSTAGIVAAVAPVRTEVGAGSLPGEEVPSWAVEIDPAPLSPGALASRLRGVEPPIFGRVQRDRLVLDMRTVSDDETRILQRRLKEALRAHGGP